MRDWLRDHAPGGAGRFARTWAAVAVLVYGVFVLGGDNLFFHSGWATVVYVVSALATLLAAAIWAAGFPISRLCDRLWPGWQPKPGGTLVVVLTTALVASLADRLIAGFLTGNLVLVALVVAVLAGLGTTRLPPDSPIFVRASYLAQLITVLGLAALLAGLVSTRLTDARRPPGRAVLLLVIDGFPTELLNTYNPTAAPSAFDDLAKEALIFDRAYTNYTYTAGFFAALYAGKAIAASTDPAPEMPSRQNLIDVLQEDGTTVEFIMSHLNAIPEANRITRYSGLRSQFLSDRYRRIPQVLGLDYHLFNATTKDRSGLRKPLYWLHRSRRHPSEEAWLTTTLVPQEFRRLRARGGNSLLIAHTFAAPLGALAGLDEPTAKGPLAELRRYAKAHDYRYLPKHNETVQELREAYRKRVDFWGRQVKALLADLRSSGALDDAVVVVTADHGTSLSAGRLWYGYHAHQSVTRVPLFMFGAGVEPGRVTAPVDTLDVAHTVAAHSTEDGVDFASGGRDLLGRGPLPPRVVASMSQRSDRRRERFFAIHTPEAEYLLNLDSEGDGRVVHGPTGLEEPSTPVDGLPAELASEVRARLEEYYGAPTRIGIHPRVLAMLGLEPDG